MIVGRPALRQVSSTDMVGAMAPQFKTMGESIEENGCKSSSASYDGYVHVENTVHIVLRNNRASGITMIHHVLYALIAPCITNAA